MTVLLMLDFHWAKVWFSRQDSLFNAAIELTHLGKYRENFLSKMKETNDAALA